MSDEKAQSVEEKVAEAAKIEAALDAEFLKEYNALTKKFKRSLAPALQIQRLQE